MALRRFAAAAAALSSLAASQQLGDLVNITCADSLCALYAAVPGGGAAVPLRLDFYAPQVVRWWLALDANFSDTGMADDVLVGGHAPVNVSLRDAGAYYEVTQLPPAAVSARVQKSPVLLSLLVDGQVVAAEASPLAWNATSSWQTLARDAAPLPPGLSAEYFFGGGMQHGRFSHRDEAVTIGVDYNWDDGGHPNSVPWFVSSAGYGVLRNTWQPGVYTFGAPVVAAHNESNRFDAFYALSSAGGGGAGIKQLLGLYTQLTGPPFLPPAYALFLGDSDCYHNDRHGNASQVAISVAEEYVANDIPAGWFLINDGYGCGYGEGPAVFPSNITDLTLIFSRLRALGFEGGLWTSTGMPNIAGEVGVAGSRVAKTDVGWIGAGYKYAFDGVALCADGIEGYSSPPARRFVWTVEGWAGTHRMAVMWTGDDSGSLDYVRWQTPSFVGAGFSAMAHVSGDVDGIFGGSPESQVRDFQSKMLSTTLMVMSGWAANPDKQPWTWGEPYTSYNRAALQLKARLTPYLYSYCRGAYETGVPILRAMLLEFPADEALYVASNASNYQFLSGEWLLAAPVFEAGAVTRDGIYLPAGASWSDWWTGALYAGGQTLDGVAAPLSIMPLFVRGGAIVPLWPLGTRAYATAPDPMTLELWPAGNSSFILYEDDGVTRAALPPTSAFGKTAIAVQAPADYLNASAAVSAANVSITVAAVAGAFAGQLASRGWRMNVRCPTPPLQVVLDASLLLPQVESEAALDAVAAGWVHNPALQGGLLSIKLSNMSSAAGFALTLSNGPAYDHIGVEACDNTTHHQVENQKFRWDAASATVAVVAPGGGVSGDCLTVGADNDPDSHTPALEVQACDAALAARQQFALVAASGQITLAADANTCLDQDVSDGRVIAYSCHDPSSPGNQRWAVNPDGASQHIVSGENGLCMCVLAP